MTTLMSEIPIESNAAAQRLRRVAAAVRVSFTWWGVHRTLTAEQKEEVSQACGADFKFLTAGIGLIKQSDIESFNKTMEEFRSELNEAEVNLNALFGQIKTDARLRGKVCCLCSHGKRSLRVALDCR